MRVILSMVIGAVAALLLEHFQQKCSRGFVSENALNLYLRPLSDGKPDSTFPESGLGAAPALAQTVSGMATAADGDSLVIGGERVRLHGIDAFEADQTCTGANGRPIACGGLATRALGGLVAGEDVTCHGQSTDGYGRMVAICTVDRRDLGAAMVRAGLAFALVRYADDYVMLERSARQQGAGAWASGEPITPPWEWRAQARAAIAEAARARPASANGCAIRGNINRQGERIYHPPGSRWWSRTVPEVVFCSVDEAEAAGFRAPRG